MTEYAVHDPRTGELVREFATDSDDAVRAAVAAASKAFEQWGKTWSVPERAKVLRRIGELHHQRRDELASSMSREMGKSLESALEEVTLTVGIFAYYADNADAFLADESIELSAGTGTAVLRTQPLGPLLGIMPWNYPVYQVARFAGPNLVAGNTIVLKHAPQCPETAELLQQIFTDAGLPTGAYVNIYATNEQVAEVIGDPRIHGVSLTGSERAGAAVAEIAGRYLKRVVLELGGSDPFLVLGTSDLDATVDAALAARLENNGQACNAAKRFLVHEDLYDEFLARFTERIMALEPSPLVSDAAAETLQQQVDRAVAEGAVLHSSGRRDGAFYPAGVLTEVSRDGAAYRQELFGPVAMVFKVGDEDEAVDLANDTPYGLGSYVFTPDADQAARVAERLDAGMVFVNGVLVEGVELPFGGIKRSGFGRELGRFGIEEFVNKKLIRTVK